MGINWSTSSLALLRDFQRPIFHEPVQGFKWQRLQRAGKIVGITMQSLLSAMRDQHNSS